MVNEQRGFFSVPHLLYHETFIYNVSDGSPRTSNIIPTAERMAVELLLPVVTI